MQFEFKNMNRLENSIAKMVFKKLKINQQIKIRRNQIENDKFA